MKRYKKKGQSTLELSLIVAVMFLFLLGIVRIWGWLNNDMTRRQMQYKATRLAPRLENLYSSARYPLSVFKEEEIQPFSPQINGDWYSRRGELTTEQLQGFANELGAYSSRIGNVGQKMQELAEGLNQEAEGTSTGGLTEQTTSDEILAQTGSIYRGEAVTEQIRQFLEEYQSEE